MVSWSIASPKRCLEIQARHPTLKLVIQEAPNGMLQDWIMRGLIGIAVVETGLPHMPRLPLGSSERWRR